MMHSYQEGRIMYLLPYVRVSNLLCQLFKRQETFSSLEKEQHDFWFL